MGVIDFHLENFNTPNIFYIYFGMKIQRDRSVCNSFNQMKNILSPVTKTNYYYYYYSNVINPKKKNKPTISFKHPSVCWIVLLITPFNVITSYK